MTLVAMFSGRSPGLTTTAHALAAAWPASRRALMAELDPGGGSLSVRYELPCEPGLTTLAAAGRRGLAPDAVLQHCRRLPDGTIALLSPVAPDRVASALTVLGSRLAIALDALPGTDVLADCGRIDSRSPALDVVRSARYVVVVVIPSLEGVAHVQARIDALALPAGRIAAVTVGSRPYGPGEVGAALRVPVLGTIGHDRRAADELAAGRSVRRSELVRSANALAQRLAGMLAPVAPEPADGAPWSSARPVDVGAPPCLPPDVGPDPSNAGPPFCAPPLGASRWQ